MGRRIPPPRLVRVASELGLLAVVNLLVLAWELFPLGQQLHRQVGWLDAPLVIAAGFGYGLAAVADGILNGGALRLHWRTLWILLACLVLAMSWLPRDLQQGGVLVVVGILWMTAQSALLLAWGVGHTVYARKRARLLAYLGRLEEMEAEMGALLDQLEREGITGDARLEAAMPLLERHLAEFEGMLDPTAR